MRTAGWIAGVLAALLLVDPWGLVALSETDPWWITAALLVGRAIVLRVLAIWAFELVARAHAAHGRPKWRVWEWGWDWIFAAFMGALALGYVSGIGRVALVGHIRDLDAIGFGYRRFEVAVVVLVAVCAELAYRRWRAPEGPA